MKYICVWKLSFLTWPPPCTTSQHRRWCQLKNEVNFQSVAANPCFSIHYAFERWNIFVKSMEIKVFSIWNHYECVSFALFEHLCYGSTAITCFLIALQRSTLGVRFLISICLYFLKSQVQCSHHAIKVNRLIHLHSISTLGVCHICPTRYTLTPE